MGNIYHEWNGTTLIITSDSGTSSCDLKGRKGDIGIRGPQPIVDNTLSIEGAAADAKAVGNKLKEIEENGADSGTDGKDGVTFTPSVDSEGNLSWTNDGGLPNPETVNIKGADGKDATFETETWTFTLEDGTTVTKNVAVV